MRLQGALGHASCSACRLSVLSSSLMPPLRKWIPGTAGRGWVGGPLGLSSGRGSSGVPSGPDGGRPGHTWQELPWWQATWSAGHTCGRTGPGQRRRPCCKLSPLPRGQATAGAKACPTCGRDRPQHRARRVPGHLGRGGWLGIQACAAGWAQLTRSNRTPAARQVSSGSGQQAACQQHAQPAGAEPAHRPGQARSCHSHVASPGRHLDTGGGAGRQDA